MRLILQCHFMDSKFLQGAIPKSQIRLFKNKEEPANFIK